MFCGKSGKSTIGFGIMASDYDTVTLEFISVVTIIFHILLKQNAMERPAKRNTLLFFL